MGKRLYVGNLSYSTTEAEIRSAFGAYGSLLDVRVVFDRETGQSKGFGFVEFVNASDADAAISDLNGYDVGGRCLRVSVAEAKPARPVGGFPDRQEASTSGFKQQYGGPSKFQGHFHSPAPSNYPTNYPESLPPQPKRFRGPKRPRRRREQEEQGWDD